MIEELFGSCSSLIGGGERKIISPNINGGIILHGTPTTHHSSSSPSPSASPTTSFSSVTKTAVGVHSAVGVVTGTGSSGAATQPSKDSSPDSQKLRCPRCDSSNTKFCYYNNYNLTQPRHFCKACRRYWTKGGALRNVPIGGGCRKSKTSTVSSAVAKSVATNKFRSLASGFMGGLDDNKIPSKPVMWALQHSPHLLALLRGNPLCPNPSPNHNSNPSMKVEEVNMFMGNNMMAEPGLASAFQMRSQGLGLDPMSQLNPSVGWDSSLWRNGQLQTAFQQEPPGELQTDNTNIHAICQRLKLSTRDCDTEQYLVVAMSGHGPTIPSSSTSSFLEYAPSSSRGIDQPGHWSNSQNNACWSDLPTSKGAYP